MQPYFIPYMGYFRLFTHADIFIILDDVQFPRRGWVHRNRLKNNNNGISWLTLPLKKASQSTIINKIEFSDGAYDQFKKQLPRFKLFHNTAHDEHPFIRLLYRFDISFIEYLILQLNEICVQLRLPFNTIRSSEISIDKTLTGSERIISLVKELNGTTYINASGGAGLYDMETFQKNGIKLMFLPEWNDCYLSILQYLLTEDLDEIRKKIR